MGIGFWGGNSPCSYLGTLNPKPRTTRVVKTLEPLGCSRLVFEEFRASGLTASQCLFLRAWGLGLRV